MVLALKYRPKKFEEIIGQEAIITTLKNSLNTKRIAHAYLFSGLRGSGKTTTARIFAKALQCEKGPTSSPCEECESCKMANKNSHIDIIEMDAASNRRIEDIRELIEHTKYSPSLGRYKIFIIDEVHMLTNEAFNALLKTLEEPPNYVKFIMATTDPLKLPATILSRVQHFRFNRISTEMIENFLIKVLVFENIEFEEKAIQIIAKTSQGSVRDSLTLLEQAIAFSKGNITVDNVVEMLGVVNPEIIEELFEKIKQEDKEEIKRLIKILKDFNIDSIIEEIIIFLKEAMYKSIFPLITIQRFFNIISDAKELLKYNTDNEFILSLMFFRMIEAIKPLKIDEMIKSLEKEVKPSQISISPIEKFKTLIKKIKERDLNLGVCFETSVKFISFENNVLKWESCPDENCLNEFKKYFSLIIRPIITEVFGEVKIEPKRCEKEKTEIKQPKKIDIQHDALIAAEIRALFGQDTEIYKIPHK